MSHDVDKVLAGLKSHPGHKRHRPHPHHPAATALAAVVVVGLIILVLVSNGIVTTAPKFVPPRQSVASEAAITAAGLQSDFNQLSTATLDDGPLAQ